MMLGCADLQATEVHHDDVRLGVVEARLREQQVGRLQVDPQVQNRPGLNDVRQTCGRRGNSIQPPIVGSLITPADFTKTNRNSLFEK